MDNNLFDEVRKNIENNKIKNKSSLEAIKTMHDIYC